MALSHTPIPPDPGYENPRSFRPYTDPVPRYLNIVLVLLFSCLMLVPI